MKMRKMISAGIVGLMAAGSFVLAGCSDKFDNNVQPTIPVSYVSLYNASPDAPDLDILVDNNQINSRPFAYGAYTGYVPFYTGDRKIQFGPYGASNVVVDTTLHLVDSTSYSIFVVDEFNKASLLVLRDTTNAVVADKANVRFVNLSPDAGDLKLSVKNGAAISNTKAFKNATPFLSVDAKTYDLSVTGTTGVSLDLPAVDLNEGSYYTVVVRGYKTPPTGNQHVLSAQVVKNY